MTILDGFWSAKQCAAAIGCSYDRLLIWRRTQTGPQSHKIGGRIFYRPEDVNAWIERGKR